MKSKRPGLGRELLARKIVIMKLTHYLTLMTAACLGLSGSLAGAGTVVVADNYNVTGSGSGFALGKGVNSGINPPTTRLTGTMAAGLRYMNTGTKATNSYTITGNKISIASATNPGRFVLSADGTTPFDFATALGSGTATPGNPVVYDLAISMDNNSTGTQRFSFAIGTAEGDATTWDIGFQLYRVNSTNNFYTIGKRIDTGASGLAADLNSAVYTMAANSYSTEISLLIRVTDAGAESTTFSSRVQLSLDGGSTWIYDTASDSDLTNGWRFDGPARIIMWDIAPDAAVTFDNFSLTWNSGPRTWTGAGTNGNWSTAANWGGVAPVTGNPLVFNGTTRQNNTNDLSGLTVPSLTFNNGGFFLYGNTFTNGTTVTNVAGNNTIKAGLAFSAGTKNWAIASGGELALDNTTSVEATGDHYIFGGGVLRVKGTMSIGQLTTINPAFVINEGKQIIDGGAFSSRGGYRIGSQATGAGAEAILTNGANFTLTVAAANLRVGDSTNPVASRLTIDNSTLTMTGGILAIPFAAGSTGTVSQNGGTVIGGLVSFSDSGAGTGSYTIKNGTLEPTQIRKNTGSGSALIYFDNAILRTAAGASSAFMTGLNTAQIQAGGLTLDARSDVTVGQVISGTGTLTKIGSNKITLTGASTYTGGTVISVGTLALGTGGSIASSPTITIQSGATFDVSAQSGYAVSGSQTFSRDSTNGVGTVNGSVNLSSGARISLQINGTNGGVGTLSFAGNLTLHSNAITVNVVGGALGVGTYPLLTYSGTESGSFSAVPTITGIGVSMGLAAKIVETSGQASLKVYVPAHHVAAAQINVVQNDLANTTNSVSITTALSVNGLQIRDSSNRGDFNVQVGSDGTDDVAMGVLMTCITQNGRDNNEVSGTNFCTSSMTEIRSGASAGSYSIPVSTAPGDAEYNINVAAALFPYTNWIGGYARNSGGTNGGLNNLFTGSPGLALGTQFIDHGDGTSIVDLTSLGIDSRTDGVLLVTHGANEANYALSTANSTNGTWTVLVKDNATNGAATEQGPVGFVFIPRTNVSVISGKFQGDGTILMYNGNSPQFTVTNTAAGIWKLSIPGYSPSSGVLVISPECGDSTSQDNIVSYQASGSDWIIQSRDLPGTGLQTPPGAVVSFVFIPAPIITLISPADGTTNVASSPNLTVSVADAAADNLTVTFSGHDAGKPYPGRDFVIPVLPDTQNYARQDSAIGQAVKEMWYSQTDWIVSHRDSDNVAFVIQLGDIVQNGDILNGNPNDNEWKIATNAMYRLENQSTTLRTYGIPYGCAVGNHDQEPNGDPDGTTTHYNQYFGTSHFAGMPYYGGHYSTNNDNYFDLFSVGGLDFIVFYFEFDRYGSGVLDWASSVIATNQNRRMIVATHYAGSDVTPSNFSPEGQAFYDRFKTNGNFFLMLGGHVFANDGEGSRSDTFNGHTVHTLISDYQGRTNGGDGMMRLMYFSPSNNVVSVKTYSSWTDQYETDSDSQFTFNYNLQLPSGPGAPATPYVAVGTNFNVASGTQTSFTWTGLQASKNYQWYVSAMNEVGDYATSVIWSFSTSSGFTGSAMMLSKLNNTSTSTSSGTGSNTSSGSTSNAVIEYVANVTQTNVSSNLKVLSAKCVVRGPFTFTWASVGGTRYRVQCAGVDGVFADIVRDVASETDPGPAGTLSTQSFTDSTISTNSVRFYRVKIVP